MSRLGLLLLLMVALAFYVSTLIYLRLKKKAQKKKVLDRQKEDKFFSNLEDSFEDTKNGSK